MPFSVRSTSGKAVLRALVAGRKVDLRLKLLLHTSSKSPPSKPTFASSGRSELRSALLMSPRPLGANGLLTEVFSGAEPGLSWCAVDESGPLVEKGDGDLDLPSVRAVSGDDITPITLPPVSYDVL